MTKKFTKFLSITAIFSAVATAGFVVCKKLKERKALITDDFNDFDDFDDDFDDLDSENRGYTSITLNTEEEEEKPLSNTLTEEEKEALTSDLNREESEKENAN